jgi:hypothetical protein
VAVLLPATSAMKKTTQEILRPLCPRRSWKEIVEKRKAAENASAA